MSERFYRGERDYTVNLQSSANSEDDDRIVERSCGRSEVAASPPSNTPRRTCRRISEVGTTGWGRLGEAIKPPGTAVG
jgi:hypothetical protein